MTRRARRRRASYTSPSLEELIPFFEHGWQVGLPSIFHWGLPLPVGDGSITVRARLGAVRGRVLRRWIRDHPGTRPFAWWANEAP